MKAYRVKITSWTASFRYPNFILGFQPTLEVPPLSTVLGLISAAAGRYLTFDRLQIGYYFDFAAKASDLEKIYQIPVDKKGRMVMKGIKSNVINREFLYDCQLILYLTDARLAGYFANPVHQLVLGRSQDLASVREIKEVELQPSEKVQCLAGQIVPFSKNYLPGEVMALPKYYTYSYPRIILGTEPYTIVAYNKPVQKVKLQTFVDYFEPGEIRAKRCDYQGDRKPLDIYFHNLDFSGYEAIG